VHSRNVALLGGMLVVSPVVLVVVHSISSSVTVVAASESLISASRVVVIASEIEGATFALVSVADSSMVA
jgi:hypothetical protein